MISRRALILGGFAGAACSRRPARTGFPGYAFVANQEGQAVAALDLETMAVAKHIPVTGSPTQVLTAPSRPSVFVLTPLNGTVHEISAGSLTLSRKLQVAQNAAAMSIVPDGSALYIATRNPRSLIRVNLDSFQAEWKISLPEEPTGLKVAPDGASITISGSTRVWLANVVNRSLATLAEVKPPQTPSGTSPQAEATPMAAFGPIEYQADSKTIIIADRVERRLSLYDVATTRLITHLPIAVRPDYMCFNSDGGQLFVAGEGMDAVVIVYTYHTPQVAETVLAGRAPGPIAASNAFLFVASSQSSDVSVLQIYSRKLIAVVPVGTDPAFIAVTPDDQYALVLNRESGDVSVLRLGSITRNRDRRAAPLTVVPVGSRPVSAVIRAV